MLQMLNHIDSVEVLNLYSEGYYYHFKNITEKAKH